MCDYSTCVQFEHMRLAPAISTRVGLVRIDHSQVGTYLRDALLTLAQTHTMIGDIRGAGLFVVRNAHLSLAVT